jgi:hypothetical protein
MTDDTLFDEDDREIAIEQMNHFLALLGEDDLHEIRPVPYASPGSFWATPRDFPRLVPTLMEMNRAGVNPYFGVNPRRAKGCTKGADSLPGFVLVADFDEGITLEVAKARITAKGLPPATAIVSTSPDHWHAYWRLDARLADLATFKRHQQALADILGTCQAVTSFQQVMRLPGPFCNVKPDRPGRPRVRLVECDPNRIYPASLFPLAAPEPAYQTVPLEQLAIVIEKGSLSDATRALIEHGQTINGKGRRASIFEAARDMHGRAWDLSAATAVLTAVGEKLGLEADDVADIPRQVKNAFATPATPGFAVAEAASIDFEASAPREAVAEDVEYLEDLEAIPLPEPTRLPDRPELFLRHGVIGHFMARVEAETEAHPVALGTALVAAVGNCIGRGPFTMVGRTPHRANLNVCITGNTASARKGTGADIIADCMKPADEYWATYCQSPNLVSGEGVVDALRDRVVKLVPTKGGGPDDFEEVVIDPGVTDKRLLITCSELAAVLKAANRENSTLSQMLREFWDGKTVRTMAKNAARTATDPHLSIVAHVTRQELLRVAKASDIFGGLMNRFVFVLSERVRLLPHGGDLDDLGTIPNRLLDIIDRARTVGRMSRSPAADRLWEAAYPELTTPTGSELLVAILRRGDAQVLRLSMLMALVAGRSVIEEADVAAALDLWRYSAASATAIFGGVEDALFHRVAEAIAAEPGITRTKLYRRLGRSCGAAALVEALGRVQAAGLARVEKMQTAGRPGERWYPDEPMSKKRKKVTKPSAETLGQAAADLLDPSCTSCPPSAAAPSPAWDPTNLSPGRYSI